MFEALAFELNEDVDELALLSVQLDMPPVCVAMVYSTMLAVNVCAAVTVCEYANKMFVTVKFRSMTNGLKLRVGAVAVPGNTLVAAVPPNG